MEEENGQETSKSGYIWGVLKDSYEFARLYFQKRVISKEQHMQSYERTHYVHCSWGIGYRTYISWVANNEVAKGCEQTG